MLQEAFVDHALLSQLISTRILTNRSADEGISSHDFDFLAEINAGEYQPLNTSLYKILRGFSDNFVFVIIKRLRKRVAEYLILFKCVVRMDAELVRLTSAIGTILNQRCVQTGRRHARKPLKARAIAMKVVIAT